MQAYETIPDASEGDIALPPGVSPSDYFTKSYSGPLLSIDKSYTAHMHTADGLEDDFFVFSIPAAGIQLNVLPDLIVFAGTMQAETSLSANVYELQRVETLRLQTGAVEVRTVLAFSASMAMATDELAAQYAQEHGLGTGPLPYFLKYQTAHAAGDQTSFRSYGSIDQGSFEERTYSTGQYVLQVTGGAVGFDLIPGMGSSQTQAGRYLVAFGNPTGQRNAAWGSDWIDTVVYGDPGELPDPPLTPYQMPEALGWKSIVPGSYLSLPREVQPSGAWRIPDLPLPPDAGKWAGHYGAATSEAMFDVLSTEMTEVAYDKVFQRYLSPGLYKTLVDTVGFVSTVKDYFGDVMGQLEKGIDAVGKDEPWSDDAVIERTQVFKLESQEFLSGTIGQDAAASVLKAMHKTRVMLQHSDITVGLGDKELAPAYTAPAGHRAAVLAALDGDSLTGAELGDLLIGNQGNDVLSGMAGNDVFVAGGGADLVDGGPGRDRAVLPGSFGSYAIARTGPGAWKFESPQAGMLASSLERVDFDDVSLALDTDGVAGQVYRLYRAAFDRVPDHAGLGFWISAADHGVSLMMMSSQFIGSAEFGQRYGQGITNAEFVARIYGNVLHRQPDPGGFEFWSRILDQGVSRTEVLATISESPENVAAVAHLIANGIAYLPYH